MAVIGFIWVSGYSPAKIREVILWTSEISSAAASQNRLLKSLEGVTFLTPALLIFIAAGIKNLIWNRKWGLLAIGLIGFLYPAILQLKTLAGKAYLPLMPAILLLAWFGFSWCTQSLGSEQKLPRRIVCTLIALLILAPWFIGLQVDEPGSIRGPGFALADSPSEASKRGVKLGLAGGFPCPTPEGPRPIGGFFHVLFGGEWRNYIAARDAEIETGIPTLALK